MAGIPSNDDVGNLRLEITATDPQGQQSKISTHLSVGNVNNAPVFHDESIVLKDWQIIEKEGEKIYTKSILLRETLILKLQNESESNTNANGLFSDPDDIHEIQRLEFSISDSSQSEWSKNIKGLASIEDDNLKIYAENKNQVGDNLFYIRSMDQDGRSTIKEFQVKILNVNDPPRVVRENAMITGNQQWKEIIGLEDGGEKLYFDPSSIFSDEDPDDRMSIQLSSTIPNWINLTDEGILEGVPTNSDVGTHLLTWRAMDKFGKSAYYSLQLNVANINRSPRVPEQINEIISTEDDYTKIDLNQLFFDEDRIHGDSLDYLLRVYDSDKKKLITPEWMKINYSLNKMPIVSNKLIIEPTIYHIGEDGKTGEKLNVNKLGDLEKDTQLRVIVRATDQRVIEKKGIVGIDLDVSWDKFRDSK